MQNRSLRILAAAIILTCPFHALGAEGELVPCPEHKIGVRFTVHLTENESSKRVLRQTITGISDGIIEINNGALLYDLVFNYIRTPAATYTPKYYLVPDCPFHLGDRVKGLTAKWVTPDGSEARARIDITTGGAFELITTPAGTFKTVKVTAEASLLFVPQEGSVGGSAKTVAYYSPEIGRSIK